MTIKKSAEFSRFEWRRNRGNSLGDIFEGKYGGVIRDRGVIGEYDVSALVMKQNTNDEIKKVFNNTYRRLVPCSVYGKLYGFMRGKPAYTGSRIYDMALNSQPNRIRDTGEKENLNYFIIGGIMFILMTPKEYEVYLEHDFSESRKYSEANHRKYLMSHPKTKEANDRLEIERADALLRWKTGAELGKTGVDLAYHGQEWDYFFTEVFPTWENKVSPDSVGMWADAVGYYAYSSNERGAIRKVRMAVSDMWSEYRKWCVAERYVPLYVKQFSLRMRSAGFMRRAGSGVRAFDVFVGEAADMTEWEQRRNEREAAVRERMMSMREQKPAHVPDSDFLLGLSGRYQAAGLWWLYEEFCRKNQKQLGFGKRQFYAWLDDNGWHRETKSGCLFMERGVAK